MVSGGTELSGMLIIITLPYNMDKLPPPKPLSFNQENLAES